MTITYLTVFITILAAVPLLVLLTAWLRSYFRRQQQRYRRSLWLEEDYVP